VSSVLSEGGVARLEQEIMQGERAMPVASL
jgi:hypothetical protein